MQKETLPQTWNSETYKGILLNYVYYNKLKKVKEMDEYLNM